MPSELVPPKELGPWTVQDCIGRGEFSGVYNAVPSSTSGANDPIKEKSWVLKLSSFPTPSEATNPKKKSKKLKDLEKSARLLFWEYQIYQNFLKSLDCVPMLPPGRHFYGEVADGDVTWRYLSLEKLGKTVKQFLEEQSDGFSSSLLASLAIQIINGLKKIHDRGIVFRDVKPENFMFGQQSLDEGWKLYFVDFGACAKYVLYTGKKVDTGTGPAGTDLYMSLNCHNSAPLSRRDDLISLGYMLVYLSTKSKTAKASLPWESCTTEQDVIKVKQNTPFSILKKSVKDLSFAKGLDKFMNSVMILDAQETPNYDSYVSHFLDLLPTGNPQESLEERFKRAFANTVNAASDQNSNTRSSKTKAPRGRKPKESTQVKKDQAKDNNNTDSVRHGAQVSTLNDNNKAVVKRKRKIDQSVENKVVDLVSPSRQDQTEQQASKTRRITRSSKAQIEVDLVKVREIPSLK